MLNKTVSSVAAVQAKQGGRLPLWLWGVIGLGAVALLSVPHTLASYQVSLVTQVLIFAVLAMSIDILAGYAGRTPLCHAAIFGTSTYVTIYCSATLGMSIWSAMVLGVLGATALSAIFALLAVRTSGVYFLLLTLALGMIVWGMCLRMTGITGGENGLRGIGRPEILQSYSVFYYFVMAVVAVVTYGLWRFVRSPFGLTLSGIRDSESRMRALGYNVSLHLFLAFLCSGAVAGIAGAMFALFNNFASPSTLQLSQSVSGLLMAIAGGAGTLFGAFIGASFIIVLENIVSSFTARWPMVLGVTCILIMIFAPTGIIGAVRQYLSKKSK